MKRTTCRSLTALVISAVVAPVLVGAAAVMKESRTLRKNIVGSMAPPAELMKADGSGKMDLGSYYKQKNTVVIFWKQGSDKNELAIKDLDFMARKYGLKGLQAVAVTCPAQRGGSDSRDATGELTDLEKEELKVFIQVEKIRMPMLIDSNMDTYRAYSINPLPTMLFIDKTGKVVDSMAMYSKINGRHQLKEKIEGFLGLKKKKSFSFASGKPKKKLKKYKPKGKADFYVKRALGKLKKDKVEDAISFLIKATGDDPAYSKPHVLLARIYITRQKNDKATIEYINATELDPENIGISLEYAEFCLKINNVADAAGQYKKVLALNEENGDAHYGLSLMLWNEGKKEEAVEGFKKVIKIFTGEGGSMFAGFSKGKEIHVNLPNSHYRLADYYLENKETDKAIESYQAGVKEYKKIIKKLLKPTH